jgi:phosphoglycerol geranylgeranyltransferase
LARAAQDAGSHAIMVGGSTGLSNRLVDETVGAIKKQVNLPVILFPPGAQGISPRADAVFWMSMLNSRNRRYIIEEQRKGAMWVKRLGLEPIAMAYLVVEPGGKVGEVGEAELIRRDDPNTAIEYALAAQYFGMDLVYLEAGSGAADPVPVEMVQAVKSEIDIPLIVGGGIRDVDAARRLIEAGADIIVTGTLIERVVDVRSTLSEFLDYFRSIVRERMERFGDPVKEPAREGPRDWRRFQDDEHAEW